MNIDEIIAQVSEEQMEKARACKSAEELIELAKTEGIELSDELVNQISGGRKWYQECDLGYSGY